MDILLSLEMIVKLVETRVSFNNLPKLPRDYIVEASRRIKEGELWIDSEDRDNVSLKILDDCYSLAQRIYEEDKR